VSRVKKVKNQGFEGKGAAPVRKKLQIDDRQKTWLREKKAVQEKGIGLFGVNKKLWEGCKINKTSDKWEEKGGGEVAPLPYIEIRKRGAEGNVRWVYVGPRQLLVRTAGGLLGGGGGKTPRGLVGPKLNVQHFQGTRAGRQEQTLFTKG